MAKFTILRRDYFHVAEICEQVIGPRTFYMHSAIGGQGWTVYVTTSRAEVEVTDDSMASWVKLKM